MATFNNAIKEWISIYAPTIGKTRGAKPLPYTILDNGYINCPEGFILNYAGAGHPAYKRDLNKFPGCIKINICGDFFNVKGGAFLIATSGFPIHITSNSESFVFSLSSVDCNIDYFVKCFNLARKWLMDNSDIKTVVMNIFIGKIITSKYISTKVDINSNEVDYLDEKWFVKTLLGLIKETDDKDIQNIINDAVEVYFYNKHNDVPREYGHQRKSMQKKLDSGKFDIVKSSKYFPIIDVLLEVQKCFKDGVIKIQTEQQKIRFQKLCKFYVDKQIGESSPMIKMFKNHGLYNAEPDEWANFISSLDFQKEVAEDPNGSKLNFALSRSSRSEIDQHMSLEKQKKLLSDLGIYYSNDENTLRGNKDLSNIWVIQRLDDDKYTLLDPLFIEVRNGNGTELISEYQSQLKYFYYCLIGRTLDNYLNARVRTYKTYSKCPDHVMQDDRNNNIGDITPLVGKKR